MKKLLKSLVISFFILIPVLLATEDRPVTKGSTTEGSQDQFEEQASLVASQPLEVKVTMKKEYMDGVSETEEKIETIWAMEDFWANYEGWKLIDQGEGFVEFEKKIEDLSPAVKANGYFGIDLNHQLTIFIGKPAEGQAMESFFTIPVETLESKRMEELEHGIKIQNKEHFKQVIKTYSDNIKKNKQ